MSRDGRRWDQLSPKERCYKLFQRIDVNTRALGKTASALVYLADGFDAGGLPPDPASLRTPSDDAPQLLVALRTIVRERQNMRQALEAELAVYREQLAAKQAMEVGHAG